MKDLFSVDGRLYNLFNKLIACVELTILWFIFSMPVISIGAATTALYDVTIMLVRNRDGHIASSFVKSFKSNFKDSTIIWCILFVSALFLGTDAYVLYHIGLSSAFWTICSAGFIGVIILFVIVVLNIFPLLARFKNTSFQMLKNAFLVGVKFLFATILMALVYGICAYISICLFTPFLIISVGLAAYVCSLILSPVLNKLESEAGY